MQNRTISSRPNNLEAVPVWEPPGLLLDLAARDPALIPELIDAFQLGVDARLHEIHAAVEPSAYGAISAAAHSIKGGARQIGADVIANICQDLELLSRERRETMIALEVEVL